MRLFSKPLYRIFAALIVVALAASGTIIFAGLPSTAHAAIPKHPRWTSSKPFGIWNNGGFTVYNNEWNTSEAGPQTIWAYSYKHWGVESRQANTTSVKTYPSVQKTYSNRSFRSLHTLASHFNEHMPTGRAFIGEAAYDVWLNNYNIEVMMWVDNHGQRPAGRVIATAKIFGQKFQVWASGNNLFSFTLSGRHETRGEAHLLSALHWLANHGHIKRSDTLTQVDFGWEICNTHRTPLDFTMTNYSLTTK